MPQEQTSLFNIQEIDSELTRKIVNEVYKSLEERGYNPTNQIVGYLISGDPGYISNYKNARNEISEYDRTEILAIILESYLDKE